MRNNHQGDTGNHKNCIEASIKRSLSQNQHDGTDGGVSQSRVEAPLTPHGEEVSATAGGDQEGGQKHRITHLVVSEALQPQETLERWITQCVCGKHSHYSHWGFLNVCLWSNKGKARVILFSECLSSRCGLTLIPNAAHQNIRKTNKHNIYMDG